MLRLFAGAHRLSSTGIAAARDGPQVGHRVGQLIPSHGLTMSTPNVIDDTYAFFRDHGYWPLVRTLQAQYGPRVNVRALAAEAGRSNIICRDGADGRCILTLPALATMPAAADDLQKLAQAVRFIARQYERSGAVQVDGAALGEVLGMSGVELARVGALLYLTGRLWSGGSWSDDNSRFSVTPSEQAFFFRDIESFADFEAVRAQIDRDDRRMVELLSSEYRRAHGEALPAQPEESRYQLEDPALDALLRRDLAELADVQSLGAWKSSAVLAGSCLETLLYDLCKRHENECFEKWRGKWPNQVTAAELAKFAAAQKWISDDHGQLAAVLRRWRNIVHPHAAVTAGEPTKELADALVAVLRLLVADLSRSDAG